MKDCLIIKSEFKRIVMSQVPSHLQNEAINHSRKVSELCVVLSKIRNLDTQMCEVMGLYHDISLYINDKHKLHAFYSSQFVKELLEKHQVDASEIDIIVEAIKNHSNKSIIHDAYSQTLKEADIYVKYLEEPDAIYDEDCRRLINKVKEDI